VVKEFVEKHNLGIRCRGTYDRGLDNSVRDSSHGSAGSSGRGGRVRILRRFQTDHAVQCTQLRRPVQQPRRGVENQRKHEMDNYSNACCC